MKSVTLEIDKMKSKKAANKKQALVTAMALTAIWTTTILMARYMYLTALGNLASK